MKKVKVMAAMLASLVILSVAAPTVLAANNNTDDNYYAGLLEGVVDQDKFKEILGGLINNGGNGTSVGLGNLSQLITAIRERLGNSYNVDQILAALRQVLGDKIFSGSINIDEILNGDIIAAIKAILAGETTTVPTTEPETEAPTEPPTEAPTAAPTEPVTEAPTRAPYTPSRSDPATFTEPETEEPTTFTYVPPERVTVPVISGESTTYNVYDNTDASDGSVTAKMVIGIIILVLSGAAVTVVAIILKKSRV